MEMKIFHRVPGYGGDAVEEDNPTEKLRENRYVRFSSIPVRVHTQKKLLSDKLEFSNKIGRDMNYDELLSVMMEITHQIPWINKKSILQKLCESEKL